MKKGRPKKKPPRFSTRILLAALAAALAINGYFAWQILGKPLQTEQTQTAAGTVPAEVQERLDAQEERDNEIAESGSVGYSPSREKLNDREAGTVYDESSALDALEAVLPAGTLSGAPKIRACQLIGELENNRRGIYGGAIGYIDFAGNMDTCIAIRIAYKKGGKVFVRSGAGIVADSVPEKEYEECINKAKAVVNAMKRAKEADL